MEENAWALKSDKSGKSAAWVQALHKSLLIHPDHSSLKCVLHFTDKKTEIELRNLLKISWPVSVRASIWNGQYGLREPPLNPSAVLSASSSNPVGALLGETGVPQTASLYLPLLWKWTRLF